MLYPKLFTTLKGYTKKQFLSDSIAVLGAIESLLSAVVSDGMVGGKHRSNMELIGQGAANIGSALFGGMPATGAACPAA